MVQSPHDDCQVHIRALPTIVIHHIEGLTDAVHYAANEMARGPPIPFKLLAAEHLIRSGNFEFCLQGEGFAGRCFPILQFIP